MIVITQTYIRKGNVVMNHASSLSVTGYVEWVASCEASPSFLGWGQGMPGETWAIFVWGYQMKLEG